MFLIDVTTLKKLEKDQNFGCCREFWFRKNVTKLFFISSVSHKGFLSKMTNVISRMNIVNYNDSISFKTTGWPSPEG